MIQNALQNGDFDELFFEILGWDRVEGSESIGCLGEIVTVKRLAEKRGIQVFVLETDQVKAQQRRYVKSVEEKLSPLAREHILVVHDPELKTQVWAWSYRDPDAGRWRQRLHPFFSECIPPKFIERLERLTVTLEDEDRVSLPEMARRVQGSLDDNADQRVFFRRPAYAAESHELALKLESGGLRALQEFVTFHSQLPVWFAKRYKSHPVDYDDIVQIASVGLIRAAKGFDPNRGTAFSTYAFHAMRTHCKRYIPESLPTVKIPQHIYWPYKRLCRLRQQLFSAGGQWAVRDKLSDLLQQLELDAETMVSLDQLHAVRSFAKMTQQEQAEAAGAVEYSEPLGTRYPARTPLSDLLDREQLGVLNECLATLEPVDQIIVRSHIGFQEDKQTLDMIASQVELTKERVRQREQTAIETLSYRLAWYFNGHKHDKPIKPDGPPFEEKEESTAMIENNPSNVSSAFEMLLEEVEAEIDFVNGIGSKAFDGRDYDKAKEALERAGVLTAFRDKVAGLRKEWKDIAAVGESQEDEETKAERRNLGKLRKGMRTSTEAYYQPILQALNEMGGSGQTGEVVDRVGQIMKGVLKDVDYQPLASSPDNLRWRNAAQWARNSMVAEGLLKADSPRGVWEITDKGREMLRDANG